MKNYSDFKSTLKEKGILKYVKNNNLNDFIKIARLHLDEKKRLYARNIGDRRFIRRRMKNLYPDRFIVNDKTFEERNLKKMLDRYIQEDTTLKRFNKENEQLNKQNNRSIYLYEEIFYFDNFDPKHRFLGCLKEHPTHPITKKEHLGSSKSINMALRLPDKEIDRRIEAALGLLKLKKNSN